MVIMRRSYRCEIIVLCCVLMALIWNLIYFKKIELKLDAMDYLSRIRMGSSEREETNEIVWPSKPVPPGVEIVRPIEIEKEQITEPHGKEVKERPTKVSAPKSKSQRVKIIEIPEEKIGIHSTEEELILVEDGLKLCPKTPPNLFGQIQPNLEKVSLDSVEEQLNPLLETGGWYKPKECKARTSVAIIVPYRNMPNQLSIFLKNLHPLLMKQQIEYGIFVVEENVGTKFNRGMLMNIGYLEARKMKEWDCYIFHDVNLLPLDDRLLYTCSKDNPRHFATAIDVNNYKLSKYDAFNGVTALTSQQFEKLNGYSNLFWGWDGHEEDFSNRLQKVGYGIERYSSDIGRYKKIKHTPEDTTHDRSDLLNEDSKIFKNSGISTIDYEILCIDQSAPYTWIFATLKPEIPGYESLVEQLGIKN